MSGGRRRNEGAIATVMERRVLTMMGGRVLTMMGGRIAMMALSSASTAYAIVGRQLNSVRGAANRAPIASEVAPRRVEHF